MLPPFSTIRRLMAFFCFCLCFSLTFAGCSDSYSGGNSEPYYHYAPLAIYAPLSGAQKTSYAAQLNSYDFFYEYDEDFDTYDKIGYTSIFRAGLSKNPYTYGNYYLMLMSVTLDSSSAALPLNQFPDIPSGAQEVVTGYAKYYTENPRAYFAYQKEQLINSGYAFYDDMYCKDLVTRYHCWRFDNYDYFSMFMNMDKSFIGYYSAPFGSIKAFSNYLNF